MRSWSVDERRWLMVRRHHLDGGAGSPEHVADALVALHATDPASVHLGVLARSAGSTLADVTAALERPDGLVRWMAMRRTVFAVRVQDVPLIHAAVGANVGDMLHRRLVSRLQRYGAEPAIPGDAAAWVAALENKVDARVREAGGLTGTKLRSQVPMLRTHLAPHLSRGDASTRPGTVTSPLLTAMAASGRLVRGPGSGPWTSRHHDWQVPDRWFPAGLPRLDPDAARRDLARRWLEQFGPATVEDLQWWTGWPKGTTRRALNGLSIEPVDLHGHEGVDLSKRGAAIEAAEAADADRSGHDLESIATLLPALDSTPMGWKHRDWLFGIDRRPLYDSAGNVGPTVWFGGEVVGGWAVGGDGEVRLDLPADRGREARAAVEAAAAHLQVRLEGAVVTPAARTPLEQALLT